MSYEHAAAIALIVARERRRMPGYRKLTMKPAFGLYDHGGKLVATCRADDAEAARDLFRQYVEKMPELLDGELVRLIHEEL